MIGLQAERRFTGILPQLLDEIETEEQAIALCNDPGWIMQEKKNGVRCLICREYEQITGIGRKGFTMPLPSNLGFDKPGRSFVVDGELVGENYFAFDLLELDGADYRKRTYGERIVTLQSHLNCLATHCTIESKLDGLRFYKQIKAEGVVFHKLSAPYLPGRNGDAIKFKF
jgi:ATP-dependent DNA ligase